MGRTIAKRFFHPYEVPSSKKKAKIHLKGWEDDHQPLYYEKIPIYFQKIYRHIDVNLNKECNSIIPSKQCLPQIIVLDNFLEELKDYIKNSIIYETVEFKIKFNELPELLDLIKSHKYFMYYLHIPKKNDGIWFAEGRFFTYEEIKSTPDEKIFKKIDDFVKIKKINYMDFLEEWVGIVFHLAAEYLLFKKKVKVIFFSCDNCYRPALLIKEKVIKNEIDDENKIWGTINIVDTIIFNCTNTMNFSNEKKKKNNNNIIYHDESFNRRPSSIYRDCEIFRNETNGAFILITQDFIWDNLIREIKEKNIDYKFDLIITGSTADKILTKIKQLNAEDIIDRVCIYTFSVEKYSYLPIKFKKIQGIYYYPNEIINFIHSKNQNSEIYQTCKLLTYNEYINQYSVLHKMISSHYGQNKENCFKIAISFLKDFLLWYPKLQLKLGNPKETKIESLLNSLQRFKGINDNEEDIIKLYTQEKNSYYQDFNYWLNHLDPLAIQKTSWFIAAVIYSLNKYSEKEGGLKNSMKLYRGIKMNLTDLLCYERSENQIICFPSFTSTTPLIDKAKEFSFQNIKKNQFATLITINYIYINGFYPTAIDVSKISCFPDEKEKLFPPYSFFKIKKVKIQYEKQEAKIELDSIGKKEIFEEKLKDGYKLFYNNEGYMEIIRSD